MQNDIGWTHETVEQTEVYGYQHMHTDAYGEIPVYRYIDIDGKSERRRTRALAKLQSGHATGARGF